VVQSRVVDGLRVRPVAEPAALELDRNLADDGQVVGGDFGFDRGVVAGEVLVVVWAAQRQCGRFSGVGPGGS
jgi:hypothetical protein